MDRAELKELGSDPEPTALLTGMGRAAMRALKAILFACTFVAIAGVVGAVTLKPIVALVMFIWEHTWPALP